VASRQELARGADPYTENEQQDGAKTPDWDDFRVLLTVVRMGSFKRAAEAMGTRQPTISRRVARLETLMGTRLVDRSNNGASLTPEGQRMLQELNIADAAIRRAFHHGRARERGTQEVTLVTTDGLATYWLSHFLDALFEMHPEISLKVVAANHTMSDRRGGFDLAIHYVPDNDSDLVMARMGSLHFIPYASKKYLSREGTPRTLADLAQHRLTDVILYLIDKGSWFTRLPGDVGQDRTQLYSNSSAIVVESIRHGTGIGLLPTYGSVFERDFVPIEVNLHFETPFWLCYRRESLVKPAVQTMIRFMKHIFNPRAMPWFGSKYVSPTRFRETTAEELLAGYDPKATDLVDLGSRLHRS
jgi:DNA-binding transcriptional LysR family regulator